MKNVSMKYQPKWENVVNEKSYEMKNGVDEKSSLMKINLNENHP